MNSKICPACGSVNTSTAHLIYEYRDFLRGTLGGMFYHNARLAQDAVARMLFARGVTTIPNIFGDIAITLWYPTAEDRRLRNTRQHARQASVQQMRLLEVSA